MGVTGDYKKNTVLNISTNLISKVIILVVGIILPKLYMENYGSEINGLLSSISNILVYVNLLESGIGGASTQALYKAIARNDKDGINSILAATNKFYHRIGIYFALIICILAVTYPYAVNSGLSYGLISALVLLSAVPSVIRYFFQGKYTILLNADNRAYVLNTVSLGMDLLTNFLKIVIILLGYGVIYVQMAYVAISMLQLMFVYVYIKTHYSYLNLKVEPNEQAIAKRKYVFVHTIASTIFSNIDVLVLTLFCDLKLVSVYSVYHMVFLQVNQLVKGIASGTSATFGQIYSVDKEYFKDVYRLFSVGFRMISGIMMLTVSVMILPFLRIYTRNVHDAKYIDTLLPIMFFISNYLDVIRWPEVIVVNSTGYFKETARQAILETMINLTFSILLVYKYGIYGVLIATTLALLYRTTDFFVFVGKNILKEPFIREILYMVVSSFVSLVIVYISEKLIKEFYSWIVLIILATVVGICSVAVFGIITLVIYPIESRMIVLKMVYFFKTKISRGKKEKL
jgi:O-antigen/teichoic acid export membrane protein